MFNNTNRLGNTRPVVEEELIKVGQNVQVSKFTLYAWSPSEHIVLLLLSLLICTTTQ